MLRKLFQNALLNHSYILPLIPKLHYPRPLPPPPPPYIESASPTQTVEFIGVKGLTLNPKLPNSPKP